MPPKKGPSKKTEEKKKEKIVEDKTFGLKNKNKSKNVQKYIQQVSHQVKGTSEKAAQAKAVEQKNKKAMKELAEAEMRALFKAAVRQPDVPPGVDPKSMLCAFFKEGMCTKGAKCKFSHDLLIERKAQKIDLYTDNRAEKEEDKMDDWDIDKLEKVINEKHGAVKQTEIVCKHFLDAIEKSQYGWFWVCPGGGKDCKYRHALPAGYVYKSRKERELEKSQTKQTEVSIEELIEEERKKLKSGGTPVTAESLAKWKADKAIRKAAEMEEKRKAEAKKSGGKGIHILSGRALFSYDPSLFRDDDEADADITYNDDDELEESQDTAREIDINQQGKDED